MPWDRVRAIARVWVRVTVNARVRVRVMVNARARVRDRVRFGPKSSLVLVLGLV